MLYTLTINQQSSGKIWEFRNTWKNVVDHHVGALSKLFVLRHWDLNFLFEFRSNFQQVGQSVIYYSNCPRGAEAFLRKDIHDYRTYTQLPHVKVNMGEDVDVPVTLKWNSPLKGECDIELDHSHGSFRTFSYDMGTLYLAVPWPMQIAKEVWPSMTVRIWSWLSSTSYGGYNPTDSLIDGSS